MNKNKIKFLILGLFLALLGLGLGQVINGYFKIEYPASCYRSLGGVTLGDEKNNKIFVCQPDPSESATVLKSFLISEFFMLILWLGLSMRLKLFK